jgi:Na+-driven multidrug efflux pump
VKGSFLFLVVVSALVFWFAPDLVALFRDDPEVIRCGAAALRFQCITFPFQSWVVMSNMMEQVMGKTLPATFISMARQGIFFIPTVLLLSYLLGKTAIQMTQAVADTLTVMCAIPIHLLVLRKMPKTDGPQA